MALTPLVRKALVRYAQRATRVTSMEQPLFNVTAGSILGKVTHFAIIALQDTHVPTERQTLKFPVELERIH